MRAPDASAEAAATVWPNGEYSSNESDSTGGGGIRGACGARTARSTKPPVPLSRRGSTPSRASKAYAKRPRHVVVRASDSASPPGPEGGVAQADSSSVQAATRASRPAPIRRTR